MRPLLLFGVLYVVFTEFVRIGEAVPFYPVVLLANIVLFTFFAEGTGAVTSLVDRENLVRKIQFPRMAIPCRVVLTRAFNLVLNLVVVLVFALASGVRPRWSWLELPLLLVAAGRLVPASRCCCRRSSCASATSSRSGRWCCSCCSTRRRSSTRSRRSRSPSGSRELIMLNPLAAILQQFRHAVIDPAAPTAAEAAGGWARLLIPAAIIVGVVALGFWVFDRDAPRIAEEL